MADAPPWLEALSQAPLRIDVFLAAFLDELFASNPEGKAAVLHTHLTQAKEQIKACAVALADNNRHDLSFVAHSLKGASGSLRLLRSHPVAFLLSDLAKADCRDAALLGRLIERLQDETALLQRAVSDAGSGHISGHLQLTGYFPATALQRSNASSLKDFVMREREVLRALMTIARNTSGNLQARAREAGELAQDSGMDFVALVCAGTVALGQEGGAFAEEFAKVLVAECVAMSELVELATSRAEEESDSACSSGSGSSSRNISGGAMPAIRGAPAVDFAGVVAKFKGMRPFARNMIVEWVRAAKLKAAALRAAESHSDSGEIGKVAVAVAREATTLLMDGVLEIAEAMRDEAGMPTPNMARLHGLIDRFDGEVVAVEAVLAANP